MNSYKIYDCFLFYNELEILEIRLNELYNVVDKFVIAEATVTHTNQQKPLYYEQNKHKFKKFQDKIIHIVIEDTPDVNVTFMLADFQMSAAVRGLVRCKQQDKILVSCVDEIPKAEKIQEWKDKPGRHKAFVQTISYYFLNCVDYKEKFIYGTRMFSYKDLMTYPSIQIARFTKPDVVIPDGGWHFSYMGGVRRIREKVAAMAHQEYNNDRYNTPEHIENSIAEGKDFLEHGLKFEVQDIVFLPKYVLENKSKFKPFIIEKFEKHRYAYLFERIYLYARKLLRIVYRRVRRWYVSEKAYFQEKEI